MTGHGQHISVPSLLPFEDHFGFGNRTTRRDHSCLSRHSSISHLLDCNLTGNFISIKMQMTLLCVADILFCGTIASIAWAGKEGALLVLNSNTKSFVSEVTITARAGRVHAHKPLETPKALGHNFKNVVEDF